MKTLKRSYPKTIAFHCMAVFILLFSAVPWQAAASGPASAVPDAPGAPVVAVAPVHLAGPPVPVVSEASAAPLEPTASSRGAASGTQRLWSDSIDQDLGGGKRRLSISSVPINYQDASGAWQAIEARFQAEGGDFINRKNSLESAAAASSPVLQLHAGNHLVTW